MWIFLESFSLVAINSKFYKVLFTDIEFLFYITMCKRFSYTILVLILINNNFIATIRIIITATTSDIWFRGGSRTDHKELHLGCCSSLGSASVIVSYHCHIYTCIKLICFGNFSGTILYIPIVADIAISC